ncbi:phosphatidate cytidylyltransferase [Corynebacterium pseudodiphtheriticum]|uniref:phosphatidate cytidylyltransferase n=1 Tax=Corynebacterium pseudodiphtheriticum TaxID=37637 RepID=UPI0020BDEAFB|nr:phosphatidate cytidylyltransferase [Corynebacterium pseudodiphtheriticum]MCT1634707.1 phosphatidate cytidylyltransferase [Corynebacterium pseudodiphtheriticum]MCT1665802.1 phosphatidate cytidylyltransferase [Corynebacterium pseudodiphtheriticum]MDC7088113.1 phosphatidate cytidylyltransferase [Corynebacterium pseudodiphtheriticum]MDK4241305.1 phosphatidate cytidylyltransferase [Corynebacterium pseudodiphtheriticum]MDK4321051.1 phosphatidate cytidylyltransferase [Corynebacterium pseudodiphthe
MKESRSTWSLRGHLPYPKNDAGRDLKVAILVGVLLGALVIGALLIGPVAWYPVVSVGVAVAMWEVLSRLRENSYSLPFYQMIFMGQAMVWLSWPFELTGLVTAFVASVLILMFGRLFHNGRHSAPQNYLRDMSVGVFVLMWIPLFASFAAMLSHLSTPWASGSASIATFMLCVVASDVGGYAAGVMFGAHPMAPAVSPKKSWEGFAGSVVFGITTGALTVHFLLHDDWRIGIVLGLGLVICATLGDLVESQFKREFGIKDMSAILPAHGGVMDRIDGMLPAAMATWLLINALVQYSS